VFIDPRRTNIFIDSCAFDPKYAPEHGSAKRLLQMSDDSEINLTIAHSTMKELEHPNVPLTVKRQANARIFTLGVQLTPDELKLKEEILRVLAGNGKRENVIQDAEHIFEAQKYGKFFVTADRGILKRKSQLGQLCGVVVLLPSEMLRRIEASA
jgi:predicted nucleic acid-binding protein